MPKGGVFLLQKGGHEMNVRKRLLALFMCICMVITLLPFSALADNEPARYQEKAEEKGVNMIKTVTDNGDDSYTITLEQWATGKVETVSKPLDIVLVLDVSGSMGEAFGTVYNPVYDLDRDNEYFADNGSEKARVTWCRQCNAWTNGCDWWFGHDAGDKFVPKTSADDQTEGSVQFYSSSQPSKLTALQSAVNSFIDSIAAKADANTDHKISIVKFAGDQSSKVGNDTYRGNGSRYNYSQIVTELTNVNSADNVTALKNTVNSLTTGGATRADFGMQYAAKAFGSGAASSDRQRVVVMFTDGSPTSSRDFEKSVANAAIKESKSLKDSGTLVYTIGVFSGANVGTSLPGTNDNTNRYMWLVSSNYPTAQSLDNTGNAGAQFGYYIAAANASELNNAFNDISTSIGRPDADLGSKAVMTDPVRTNFTVPADASDVKVYTAKYDGSSFGDREELTDAVVTVDKDNNTVSVTNFDYSANYVTDTAKPETGDFGSKLIVEFTVKVDRTKTYGGTQPTNDGAKITLDGETVITVDDPKVPVVIKPVGELAYSDSKKYDGGGFDISAEISKIVNAETNTPVDGSKNAYVDIVYEVKDESGALVGTYTVKAGEASGEWVLAQGADVKTGADFGTYTYQLTCTMSDAAQPGAETVVRTGSAVFDITKRTVKMTSASDEKFFDGLPLTNDTVTVTGDGFVNGEGAVYTVTGSQTDSGSSPNFFDYKLKDNTKAINYDITTEVGTLLVKQLLEKEDHFNYIIGYPDGTIQPDGNITRAEIATIFFRLLTDDARAELDSTVNNFSDVNAGDWHNRAISTLANAGILRGYEDGTFRPDEPITRAEMATIIARFDKRAEQFSKTFNDIDGHWAQADIELAANKGWVNGYDDGSFKPDNCITRAETFAMVNRVLERHVVSQEDLLLKEMNIWSDNMDPLEWYYYEVQEATNNHECQRIDMSPNEKWTQKLPDIDWASYQI